MRQAWGHTCCSSLLKAAQNLLTQEMNQPSHNLRVEKEQTQPHILNQEGKDLGFTSLKPHGHKLLWDMGG